MQSSLQFYPLELGQALREEAPLQQETGVYLVGDGRVRVLGHDASLQKVVPAQLLTAGAAIGLDAWFEPAIAYRVVAASEALLVYIPPNVVQQARQTDSKFESWLAQHVAQRQLVLFWKTQTPYKNLPGRYIQDLLPYLMDVRVAAGASIADTLAEPAYFWLRQGMVRGQAGMPLQVGEGYGYPQPIPADWRAETDVRLCVLPARYWEAAIALIPGLAQTAPEMTSPATTLPSASTAITSGIPAANPVRSSSAAQPQPSQIREISATNSSSGTQVSNVVAFPQPGRGYRRRSLWRRFPFVEQQSSSDCGLACLSMIACYWGKHFPLYVLRENAHVGQSGTSLKGLAKVSEEFGFSARPVRASFSRVAEQRYPWIAHWQGDHYVVVYQIKRGRVLIADPAVGKRSISMQEFQANWTDYALLLEPTDRLYTKETPKASLGRYFNTLSPYRSLIFQVVFVSVLIQLFGLVTPLLTQIILDRVIVQKSLTSLNVFAIGLLLFGIWTIGIVAVRQYLLSYISNRLDLTLISGFIHHTLTLPLKFFESRRVGDIITRVQENQKIQRFLVERVVIAMLDFVTGFVYLGLMLYYSPQLTLLVLMLVPLIVILTLAATPLLQKVSREIFKETAEQNSVLVETISGIAMIKAAAVEPEMRWQWEEHLTRQMNVQFRGQKLGIRLQFLSGLINSIGSTLLLWYGATLVIQGDLTIGQLIAFNMMMGYIIHPVISMANLWDELQEVLIAVERLNDVFAAQPENNTQTERFVLPPLQGHIRLEDVTFRYSNDEERNILQNITLEAQPGETIALVGTSGSGKTTLVKLLQGLYHPNRGRVLIDEHDVRHVATASLRSQMGVVPQECFLFSGTILENIRLYRQDINLEQVIEAAKLAEAHSFIQALPLSYNTKVGERGSTLSGGQRQRIAIARALLGNPRILILDEATSALDTESERRFQRNLEQIRRDRTTFIIAHRLSTVRHADRIVVLNQGVIVEQGTHTELMQQQGFYFHLVQQQLAL
jgi:ATP-binding cassette subfamily B protein